ncbi:MAG: riboflavin synthase subunit alpha [Proteobacteria bacterium]|nr:riboflavin synthase subunit alpha [Pseudomonadota bacterium]
MYTGIVQDCLPITAVDRQEGLYTFQIELPPALMEGLETGASVAVNGVCFTVTAIEGCRVAFDAIRETLALSNIRFIEAGTLVNIERSAKAGVEVGGHILSGHVVGTAEVIEVDITPNNRRLTFSADPAWLKFVFEKGFLAVNGASLTVAALDRDASTFAINLIPETLERTNFRLLKAGDLVNIEVESQTQVIVETVERIMAERFPEA